MALSRCGADCKVESVCFVRCQHHIKKMIIHASLCQSTFSAYAHVLQCVYYIHSMNLRTNMLVL